MSKSPAFQFYAKDWLSSADVQLMTPAHEGAYIRLLAYCWESGDCSLPDDDAQLAVLSRLNEGWFNGGSTIIRRKFIQHPTKPGFLTNERLIKEAHKQLKWSQKSSEGGKKSAANRSEKKAGFKGGSKVVEPKANSSSSSSTSIDKSISGPPPHKMPFTEIPDEWKHEAMKEMGWPENVTNDIWANFREYWQNGKGRSTKRGEWSASWRTWYRKEKLNTGGNYGKQTRPTTIDIIKDGIALARAQREQASPEQAR